MMAARRLSMAVASFVLFALLVTQTDGRDPATHSSPVSDSWHVWSVSGDEELVVSARRVFPEWPRLKEVIAQHVVDVNEQCPQASWEVRVHNPSLKPVQKQLRVDQLLPRDPDHQLAALYASNDATSGRSAGE